VKFVLLMWCALLKTFVRIYVDVQSLVRKSWVD